MPVAQIVLPTISDKIADTMSSNEVTLDKKKFPPHLYTLSSCQRWGACFLQGIAQIAAQHCMGEWGGKASLHPFEDGKTSERHLKGKISNFVVRVVSCNSSS